MNKTPTINEECIITCDTPEYKALTEAMRCAIQASDRLIADAELSLLGERYLTTEQMMTRFHISRRALQNYRDRGIIPYTSIGGILLYPESKINEVLEKNYYKPTIFSK